MSYMQKHICVTCEFLKSLDFSQTYPGSQQQGLDVGFAQSGLDAKQRSARALRAQIPRPCKGSGPHREGVQSGLFPSLGQGWGGVGAMRK